MALTRRRRFDLLPSSGTIGLGGELIEGRDWLVGKTWNYICASPSTCRSWRTHGTQQGPFSKPVCLLLLLMANLPGHSDDGVHPEAETVSKTCAPCPWTGSNQALWTYVAKARSVAAEGATEQTGRFRSSHTIVSYFMPMFSFKILTLKNFFRASTRNILTVSYGLNITSSESEASILVYA